MKPELLEIRKQFLELSPKKQRKLVEYLYDPAVLSATFSNMGPNSKAVLYGGDVVITQTTSIAENDHCEGEKQIPKGSH